MPVDLVRLVRADDIVGRFRKESTPGVALPHHWVARGC
jgi:hypothetical protein